MPVNSWENIADDELEMTEVEYEKKEQNISHFFPEIKKIKKIKFTDEEAKTVRFADITKFMTMKDPEEARLGAYDESEYFAYGFQREYGFYPNVLTLRFVYSEKFLKDLFKHAKPPENSYYTSYEFRRNELYLSVTAVMFDTGRDDKLFMYVTPNDIRFFYNKADENDPESMFSKVVGLVKSYLEPKTRKNRIYVVYQAQGSFEKTGFNIKKVKVDLKENYNDGFEAISDKIIKGLNDKKESHLVILQGPPGVGKTMYIRYLASKIKKNIIFIAPDMVEHITDPAFIPFLITNNNTVLIIEDAEPALQSRNGNARTSAVSNVLNLTDGLLSDCLNISIVATFNTSGKNLDEALLRKGRLLINHKFDKLSVEKSRALLKKLGREDVEVKEPMTLAEIYYYGEDNKGKGDERKKIGF